MEATLSESPGRRWSNRHQNFTQRIEGLWNLWPPDVAGDQILEGMRATVRGIQSAVRDASRAGSELRALGGGWSLSRIAATSGRMLNTKPVNWMFSLADRDLEPAERGVPKRFLCAQGGAHIGELSFYLENPKRKRALKTSGASNGQTIAGAIATGTHGSVFTVGALHDSVVGLHLVTGTGPASHIWLEPARRPVVGQTVIDGLATRLIRDDELFDAALVGLGSMGIVHAVLLETAPLYLLEASRQKMAFDAALRQTMGSLDFAQLPLPQQPATPYHFEVVINPHENPVEPRVTAMYKIDYAAGERFQEPTLSLGDDALAVMGFLSDLVPGLVPPLINLSLDSAYPPYAGRRGTHGEVFGNTTTRGTATAVAMGVALGDTERAVETLFDVNRGPDGPFPGLFAVRYVKSSSALLAFTGFDPVTAVVELDGIQSNQTTSFYQSVWSEMEARGIPFTLHWGKVNDYLTAARVRRMYGERAERWKRARQTLLTPTMFAVLQNPFLRRAGLAD